MAKKVQKKSSKKTQTKSAAKAKKGAVKTKKAAAPAKQTKSPAKKAAEPKKKATAKPAKSTKSFSVADFARMTYLTEKGVRQWLQQGLLKGQQNASGEWQIEASNLEVPNVKRLVR
jgi:hypothetical protein